MDENPTSGTAKNLEGKVEEGFARVTGDAKTKAQGQMKQAEGSIQDPYGQAVDAPRTLSTRYGRCPLPSKTRYVTTSKIIRNTTAAIALGLGWLIGRSHRPF
jgi:uncharacterized protein YjbJ (UPF0337 family)